jgi:hypothetical protein
MKELKGDPNRWKDTLCSRIRRLNRVKIKIAATFLVIYGQANSKILTERHARIATEMLENNTVGRTHTTSF